MNLPIDPDIWQAEWQAWREARRAVRESQAARNQPQSGPLSGWHTVSAAGPQIAVHLLNQFRNSTAPTLDREIPGPDRAGRADALTVSAAPADAPWKQGAEKPGARLEAGAILHLHPDWNFGWEFPLQALVIEVRDRDRQVLLAPFSPLPFPSCEGELSTGIEDASLAVVCVWNTRWLDETEAQRSWRIGAIDRELLADILRLRDSLRRGEGAPPDLRGRVAAPVVHPDDPRWEYLDELEECLGSRGRPENASR